MSKVFLAVLFVLFALSAAGESSTNKTKNETKQDSTPLNISTNGSVIPRSDFISSKTTPPHLSPDSVPNQVVSLVPENMDGSRIPTSTFDKAFSAGLNETDSSEDVVKAVLNFLDSPLMDIVWCGENKDVIFILSEKSTLYRSVDDAVSGQLLTSHLNKLGRTELADEGGVVSEVSRIMQNPVDSNMLLFVGTHGVNWITEDCGASFRAMNQGRKVDEFQFHPTEREWLLASAWTICDDFLDEPCLSYKELFVTNNLGVDWTLIASYVIDFSWAHLDFSFFRVPKERIIISHDLKTKGNQKISTWKKNRQVSYSDDYFNKTTIPITKGGNKFLLTANFLFVVKIADEEDQHVNLPVSNPKGFTYDLKSIEIPNQKINEHGYTVLDTSEHSVFLHIDHKGSNTPFGHLYVSDSTGVRYSLALKNNVKDMDGQCDFEGIQGIEGVYLANIYDENVAKKYNSALKEGSQFPVQGSGSKKTTEDAYQRTDKKNVDLNVKRAGTELANLKIKAGEYKKTKISFNKGNTWDLLTAPKKDARGNKTNCHVDDGCSLHLHSLSSTRFGPFYSTENSLGLVFGTGNFGQYLSNKPDEINTYFTRNAGLSWYELSKGSHIYEVGDHGGIIVMASNQNATRSIIYSWNEGQSWTRLKISDTYIQVTNIIIEPSNVGEKFIIYGREAYGSRGIVVALDFSSLHPRVCQNPDTPNTPESDYETWSPNGKISAECLLGRKVTYVRRKRDSQCFNQEEFDRWRFDHRCECTEDDWECDFGYERKGNGPCLPMNETDKDKAMLPPEQCDSYYFATQGYRKVAGNICEGGLSHDPLRLPCPGIRLFDSKSSSAWFMLAFAAVIVLYLQKKVGLQQIKGHLVAVKTWTESWFKDPRKEGYMNQVPDTMRDGDNNDFSNQLFDEESDETEQVEEPRQEPVELMNDANARKMNESRGINAANERVPLLARPGDRGKLDQIRGSQ